MENIYKLKLNETINTANYLITRVPSGWIYIFKQKNNYGHLLISNPVFVPFDNSFQKK